MLPKALAKKAVIDNTIA